MGSPEFWLGTRLEFAWTVQALRVFWLIAFGSGVANAQPSRRAHEIPSMGQPSKVQPYFVPSSLYGPDGHWRGGLALGLHRPITNPVVGLLGVTGEAYATVNPGVRPGARLMATSRVIGLAGGV